MENIFIVYIENKYVSPLKPKFYKFFPIFSTITMGGELIMVAYEGYCMKCKKKQDIKNPEETFVKGKVKMKAVKGTCTKCGTKMYKIVGKA